MDQARTPRWCHQTSTATDILDSLIEINEELASWDEVVVMGDSAGGMALGLAQLLRDRELPAIPAILLCPHLDCTMTNPGALDRLPNKIPHCGKEQFGDGSGAQDGLADAIRRSRQPAA